MHAACLSPVRLATGKQAGRNPVLSEWRMEHRARKQVVQAVASVLGEAERPIALHVPSLGGNCGKYVLDCVKTGWVSSVGAYVERFEREIADYTGAKRAVACVNGTAALHIALLMAGVKPGDEVLCPSLTFVATANAITYAGAVPHFVEINAATLGVDPGRLEAHLDAVTEHRNGRLVNRETGRRVAALIGMHALGHPFDIDGTLQVCHRIGVPLVEDAAESLGSIYHDRHTGTFGQIGILSFNGNKIVTTGGGGMILANDSAQADWAKHVTTTAKQPHRWAYRHDEVGFNYRMPNLNAALGCGQLEQIDQMLAAKRALAQCYIEAFEPLEGMAIIPEPEGTRSNYWLASLVLDEALACEREAIIDALHEHGFLVRPIWTPMHELAMYRDCPRMDLPVTRQMAGRVISLPGSACLYGDQH